MSVSGKKKHTTDHPNSKSQVSDEAFTKAIYLCAGKKNKIAKMLNLTWLAVHKRISNNAKLRDACIDAEIKALDLAEDIMVTNMEMLKHHQDQSQKPVDTSDVKWFLERKGKKIGYAAKQEISGNNRDDSIQVEITVHSK